MTVALINKTTALAGGGLSSPAAPAHYMRPLQTDDRATVYLKVTTQNLMALASLITARD